MVAGSQPNGYSEGMIGTGATAGSRVYLYNQSAAVNEASIYVDLISEAHITGDNYSISLTDYAMDSAGDTTYASLLTTSSGDEELVTGITMRNTSTSSVLFESRVSTLAALGTDSHPVTEGFRLVAIDPNDGQPGLYDFSVVDVPDSSGWSLYRDRPYSRSLERIITRKAYWDFDMIWRTVDANGDTNKAVSRSSPYPVVNAPFEIWRSDTSTRVWPLISDYEGSSPDWDSGWEYIYVTDIPYTDNFFDAVLYPEHDPASAYWSWDEDDPLNSRSDWLWEFGWNQSNPNTWYEGETWVATVYRPLAIDFTLTGTFSSTAPILEDDLIDYDDIQAVPNPYIISADWDQNVNRRKIQFTNVPAYATVDIYTLAGELIASLDHGGFTDPDTGTRDYNSTTVGTVDWKIWTYEFTEAAYGLYIYVVKVGDDVKKVGKLSIIR